MLGQSRRRFGRPEWRRRRGPTSLEALERRALLTAPPGSIHFYQPRFLPERTVEPESPPLSFTHPYGNSPQVLASLGVKGRVLTGKDREGDEWTLTLHGPGYLIVTDATPNDGVFDDNLDTIQIVGSDPNQTYVTGQVTGSARLVTDGTVRFNRLVALNGVKSIVLNGFTLARTVPPPAGTAANEPEIDLPGGVGLLQFHDIEAPIDLATNAQPIDIVIGQPNVPLKVAPTIRLDRIFNTVFDSTQFINPNGTPQTTPTVNIVVNGQIHGLEFVSSTNQPVPAGAEYRFPKVGTTGRTAVRALGINRLKVVGTANNVTVSRGAEPFQTSFSGMKRLNRASFGGNADAVGIDVSGPIRSLKFYRGLGSPIGTPINATEYGYPEPQRGYPSFGLYGGLVTATDIGQIQAAPANRQLLTAHNPDFIQLHRTGSTTFYAAPGRTFNNVAIASSGSLGSATTVGTHVASEVKTGFDYQSYTAGLEGVRAPSRIRNYQQHGDLVDSVVSATYRAVDGVYGNGNDTAGPGKIRGRFGGRLASTGFKTILNQTGVGFYARRKRGYLPPPEAPARVFPGVTR
ncbi:MAG: hypothetical protein IRY99_05690 [Isosphaeraceae bacterium]|nr:hypothetical protein [Isosphaeraceae bacterium]